MLGEKIGEMTGRVTGTRVLPGDDYRYVKMEVTIQESGTLYGGNGMNIGTYTVFESVPGQLFGEGQGMFQAGSEGAIWKGQGIGKATGEGMSMSFRFSLAMQAGAGGALGRLNDVLVIGEHEVDANGSTKTVIWEWK